MTKSATNSVYSFHLLVHSLHLHLLNHFCVFGEFCVKYNSFARTDSFFSLTQKPQNTQIFLSARVGLRSRWNPQNSTSFTVPPPAHRSPLTTLRYSQAHQATQVPVLTAPAVVTKSATNSVYSFHLLVHSLHLHLLNHFCVFGEFCVKYNSFARTDSFFSLTQKPQNTQIFLSARVGLRSRWNPQNSTSFTVPPAHRSSAHPLYSLNFQR